MVGDNILGFNDKSLMTIFNYAKKSANRLIVVLFLFCYISYSYADEKNNGINTIDGINFENYPKVDGSTSTKPLNALIACKLLGLRYDWESNIVGEWSVKLNQEDIPENYSDFYGERIKASQTHNAFMNVIDGTADIILTHRTISPDEKMHADSLEITLIESSIAIDAFIFLVNKNNPIRNLTVNQVQQIYSGEITNWQQVGGSDLAITPFTRPRNSGSEEVMRSLVMGDLETGNFPSSSEIVTMAGVFPEVRNNTKGFCYIFNFYKDIMVRVSDEDVPKIAINGIFPDANTVKNGTYPFIAEVHVAIRSNLDHNSMAYKMYEWLQTEAANAAISESGYIPKNMATSVSKISTENLYFFPNQVSDGFYVNGLEFPAQFILFNISGTKVFTKQVTNGEYININKFPHGVYFAKVNNFTTKIIKK